ncbi:MAG: alpha-L-fucosidase [Sphingobacteriales bacterium]|nr:alpha-L-fucosidase [Sphingobacteriales bacterium]
MSFSTFAQHEKYYPDTDVKIQNRLEEWRDLKFGLLMHWGPYSQWGVVESWSICPEDLSWAVGGQKKEVADNYFDYVKAYENLQTTFNPTKFNPEKWAAAAKYAGMKYMVFTTKHHDGFSMFDTKYTDYKITDKKTFVDFTHKQVNELVTGYGQVDILWFDGGWVRKTTDEEVKKYLADTSEGSRWARNPQNQDINMAGLVKEVRAKQPNILVVDRAVEGPEQNYLTPEQQIPAEPIADPWETCMTMGNSWSYVPNDVYKPAKEIIEKLVDIVSKGGNYLLNIGP